jgi:hypothetical protein
LKNQDTKNILESIDGEIISINFFWPLYPHLGSVGVAYLFFDNVVKFFKYIFIGCYIKPECELLNDLS